MLTRMNEGPEREREVVFQVGHRRGGGSSSGLPDQVGRRGDVRDDLVGVRTDADVAEVGEGRQGAAARGEADDLGHREGDVAARLGRQLGVGADLGDVGRPAGQGGVDGLKGAADALVSGKPRDDPAGPSPIACLT